MLRFQVLKIIQKKWFKLADIKNEQVETEETPEEIAAREAKEAEEQALAEQKAKEEAEAQAKAEEQAKKQAESVPREYKSALTKAELYAQTMYMSKAGIYDQLTSEYGENFLRKQHNTLSIILL